MVPFVFGLYADSFPRIYLYILAIYGSFNIFVFGACQLLATKIKDIKMKRINCDLS